MTSKIYRPAAASDQAAIAEIAEATLFPGDMVPGMMAPYLSGNGGDLRWVAGADGEVAAFAFAQPEIATDNTWNVRAIAVRENARRQGLARGLIESVETGAPGARLLIIDTSQVDEQAAARQTYLACGYTQVAHIADFWADCDDKVSFAKRLA